MNKYWKNFFGKTPELRSWTDDRSDSGQASYISTRPLPPQDFFRFCAIRCSHLAGQGFQRCTHTSVFSRGSHPSLASAVILQRLLTVLSGSAYLHCLVGCLANLCCGGVFHKSSTNPGIPPSTWGRYRQEEVAIDPKSYFPQPDCISTRAPMPHNTLIPSGRYVSLSSGSLEREWKAVLSFGRLFFQVSTACWRRLWLPSSRPHQLARWLLPS